MRRLQRFELKKTSSSSSFKARSKSARLFNVLIAHGERSKEVAGDSSNTVPTGFGIKEEGNGEGSRQIWKTRSSSASWKESIVQRGSSSVILSLTSIGKRFGGSWRVIISVESPCRRLNGWRGSRRLLPTLFGKSTSWVKPIFLSSAIFISSAPSITIAGSSPMVSGFTVSMGLTSIR